MGVDASSQIPLYFYCLQRSCEGYVFTDVCLSTGVSASVHAGIPPLGADTPQGCTSGADPPGADPPEQTPLEQTPPWSGHPPGGDTPPHCPTAHQPPGSRHPLWEQTPPLGADTPPEQTPPGEDTPPHHPLGADPPRSRHSPGRDGRCWWNAFLFSQNVRKTN